MKLGLLIVVLLLLLNPVAATSHGAYGIKVTASYVHADGAKCSCSLSDGYYYHHNLTFKNRCPNCGGGIAYEVRSYWVEGIWYCTRCDMDYCVVHGKSHDNRNRYLTRTTIPKPVEKQVPVIQESVQDMLKRVYHENKDRGLSLGNPV